MLQMKAYKFRMYPTKEQEILINKTLGCSRFIYNYFLSIKKEQYKQIKTSMSAYECCKEIKNLMKEHEWLKEVDSCALRTSIFNLDDAFTRMYKKQNGCPRFKSKHNKQNYNRYKKYNSCRNSKSKRNGN